MEPIEALLNLLGSEIKLQGDDSYKNFELKNRHLYFSHLENLTNQFKIALVKQASTVNFFDLLKKITDIQQHLTNYYQTEILSIEPIETGIDKPEVKEWEDYQKKKFRDNSLHFLSIVIRHEIDGARDIKNFIIKTYDQTTQIIQSNQESGAILERVRFEGDQYILVALFQGLQLTKKLSFNKESTYPTEQIHFENFLEKNFSYKSGMKYMPVKNVKKALADIRQQYQSTADTAKEKVDSILELTINSLNDFKEELKKTELRHKEKNIKHTD